jgi:RNA polymerase primary sigma factor
MEEDTPVDPVTMYLRELSTVIPLDENEESRLFRELRGSGNWNEGQENAARRLIETHLKLVVAVAEKHSSSGISMLELIQEGNLGLINAVRSFAQKPTGDFSCYAEARIERAIANAIEKIEKL